MCPEEIRSESNKSSGGGFMVQGLGHETDRALSPQIGSVAIYKKRMADIPSCILGEMEIRCHLQLRRGGVGIPPGEQRREVLCATPGQQGHARARQSGVGQGGSASPGARGGGVQKRRRRRVENLEGGGEEPGDKLRQRNGFTTQCAERGQQSGAPQRDDGGQHPACAVEDLVWLAFQRRQLLGVWLTWMRRARRLKLAPWSDGFQR